MTSGTHHNPNHVSYRYWSAPIRAAFVPCPRNEHFRVRCGQEIWSVRPATDPLDDEITRMNGLTAVSTRRATIQIPIAMWFTLTPAKHPAVSSLGAYPTPAH